MRNLLHYHRDRAKTLKLRSLHGPTWKITRAMSSANQLRIGLTMQIMPFAKLDCLITQSKAAIAPTSFSEVVA